jgi:hypothetical protein
MALRALDLGPQHLEKARDSDQGLAHGYDFAVARLLN